MIVGAGAFQRATRPLGQAGRLSYPFSIASLRLEARSRLRFAARSIRVILRASRGTIILTIKDNGCGFKLADTNGKVTGLKMMSRRAQTVGGELRAESRVECGTDITCKVPA